MKMSKRANFFWRVLWTFCLFANLMSWITHWTVIGMADSLTEVKMDVYVWMPLAGLLTVFSALRFMELNREAHREVEEPAS